jgi:hypothetical protein
LSRPSEEERRALGEEPEIIRNGVWLSDQEGEPLSPLSFPVRYQFHDSGYVQDNESLLFDHDENATESQHDRNGIDGHIDELLEAFCGAQKVFPSFYSNPVPPTPEVPYKVPLDTLAVAADDIMERYPELATWLNLVIEATRAQRKAARVQWASIMARDTIITEPDRVAGVDTSDGEDGG